MTAEDDSRWGDRQMCGEHLKKGTSHGCANGFCWEWHGQRNSRWASWEEGEVVWQGVVPGLPFSWLKGAPLRCRTQTDPLARTECVL